MFNRDESDVLEYQDDLKQYIKRGGRVVSVHVGVACQDLWVCRPGYYSSP